MAIDWCAQVNGTTMLPKLLVYLRTHRSLGTRNQRVRKVVKTASRGEVELARINKEAQQVPAVSTDLAPTPALQRMLLLLLLPLLCTHPREQGRCLHFLLSYRHRCNCQHPPLFRFLLLL